MVVGLWGRDYNTGMRENWPVLLVVLLAALHVGWTLLRAACPKRPCCETPSCQSAGASDTTPAHHQKTVELRIRVGQPPPP